MKNRIILIAAIASFAAPAAFAGSAFDDLDADGSGGLSFSEAQAADPALTPEIFASADTDGSGELSHDEFDALKASMSE